MGSLTQTSSRSLISREAGMIWREPSGIYLLFSIEARIGSNSGRVRLGISAHPIHEDTMEAGILCAADIRGIEIADKNCFGRLTSAARERQPEDFRMRLFHAHEMGVDNEFEVARQIDAAKLRLDQAQ